MIEFPDWYQGGYPDAELVMRDLLKRFLDQCDPAPTVYNWLPPNYDELIPLVTVFRGAGIGEPNGDPIDVPQIQVWVILKHREDSQKLMEFCRRMIATYCQGGRVKHEDGSFTALNSACEIVGPELVPGTDLDERAVIATFQLETKKPVGTPTYIDIREQLHS